MTDFLNGLAMILTVGFGAFGFLFPRYTAGALDLRTGETTMGLSEMRASVGGLFVIMGIAGFWMDSPVAYSMVGFAYVGAAMGRFLSLVLDSPPVGRVIVFGGIEALMAAWLLYANF